MRKFGAVMALFGMLMAGAAQADDHQVLSHADNQVSGSFIYSTQPGYWRFLMGPANTPQEMVMLYHGPDPQVGGLSLACRRDGGGKLNAVVIAPEQDLHLPVGTAVTVQIDVDGEQHPLAMNSIKDGGLFARGPAALAILDKIGKLDQGFSGEISASYKGQSILHVALPPDHLIPADVAHICGGWAAASVPTK